MRHSIVVSLLAAFCVISTINGKQGHPIPPGVRQADKQINKPLEPSPAAAPNKPDLAKLKQEADELAQLSAEIPSQLDLVAHGQLPKELSAKLKRIERLAKHLRSEVTP
jgi:hypothetical protein